MIIHRSYTYYRMWFIFIIFLSFCAISTTLKTAEKGSDVKLQCKFQSTIKDVLWLKDGHPIDLTIDRHKHFIRRKGGRVFKIRKVKKSDGGLYSCIDIKSKRVLFAYNVSVSDGPMQKKPYFKDYSRMIKQRYIVKLPGDDLNFNCLAGGEQPIYYKWYKDGNLLLTKRDKSPLVTHQAELKLRRLGHSDSAKYTCRAGNKFGSVEYSMELNVQDKKRSSPIFLDKDISNKYFGRIGENITVKIQLRAFGNFDFQLLLEKRMINETTDISKSKLQVLKTPSKSKLVRKTDSIEEYQLEFYFSNLKEKDFQKYTAMVRNIVGYDIYRFSIEEDKTDRSIQKKPHFKDSSKMVKQRFIVKLVGDDLKLNCLASGDYPIIYKWYKDNDLLLNRLGDSSIVTNQAELKLRNLVYSDSAKYTCRVENKYGSVEYTMKIDVQEKLRADPFIEKSTFQNQTRFTGENVSIECFELTGTNQNMRWLKGKSGILAGMREVDNDKLEVVNEEFYQPIRRTSSKANGLKRGVELKLNNVAVEDSGWYTCAASNDIGNDYASMYLKVIQRTG